MRSSIIPKLLGAVTALQLSALTAGAAITPADSGLIQEGREILNYLEGKAGNKMIAGNMPQQRHANQYQLMGRRGAIWHFELDWMQEADLLELVEDYKKYRPIIMLQQSWYWNPDGDNRRYRGERASDWTTAKGTYAPLTDKIPANVMDLLMVQNSPAHLYMESEFQVFAEKLLILQENNVPVIFSPFNEICGGWFFWSDQENPRNSAQLFKWMFQYFQNFKVVENGVERTKNLNNIIWCYNHGQTNDPLDTLDFAYHEKFSPGSNFIDMVTIGKFNSSNIYDRVAEEKYYELATRVGGGEVLFGDAEVRRLPNPDLMVENSMPRWIMAVPWEGAPYKNEDHSVNWADYTYGHNHVISLDELPKLGSDPTNLHPEVSIIEPDAVTWVYDADPVIEALAEDRDGTVQKVEFYADGELIGTDTTKPYRIVWTDADDGLHRVSAKAYDNSGNVSDSLDMGGVVAPGIAWSNSVEIMKGYFNAAKGKAVEVSSIDTAEDAVTKAEWLTDGHYESTWIAASDASEPDPDNQWFTVDLGKNYWMTKAIVRFGWKVYAEEIRVDVKVNGNWQNFHTTTNFDAVPFWGAAVECDFTSGVSGRHLRVRLKNRIRGIEWSGFEVSEFEVPVSIPAGEPNYLELYNERVFWDRVFPRTALATPASVESGGSNHNYQKLYFDSKDDSMCGKVRFNSNYAAFQLAPHGGTSKDLRDFNNGFVRFQARSSVNHSYQFKVIDGGGTRTIDTLNLTQEWQDFVFPMAEVRSAGVNLASVKWPFMITKGGTQTPTLYFRDVYWSTESSPTPAADNILLDSSFQDGASFLTTGNPYVHFKDEDKGWIVFKGTGTDNRESIWNKNGSADHAHVRAYQTSWLPDLVQAIGDHRATTGLQMLSLDVQSSGNSSTSNGLKMRVFGVNSPSYRLSLVDGSLPRPRDPKMFAPTGDILVDDAFVGNGSGEIKIPFNAKSGYETIIVLLRAEGVDYSAGDRLIVDNVRISPNPNGDPGSMPDTDGDGNNDGPGGPNPVIDSGFNGGFTNSGSWAYSTDSSLVGAGWVTNTGNSKWNWVNDPNNASDKIASADNGGAGCMAQIILDNNQTTGRQNIAFDASNVGSGNKLQICVWGVNEEFKTNMHDATGPIPPNGSTMNGTVILAPTEIADEPMDWRTPCLLKGDAPPVGHNINFGTGYKYILVKVFTKGVGSAEQMLFDNFVIGSGESGSNNDDNDNSDNNDNNDNNDGPSDTIVEPFNWAGPLDTSMADNVGSANGSNGLVWSYNRVGEQDSKSITGTSLLLQRRMSASLVGWIEADLPQPISGFKVKFQPRYNGQSQIKVVIGNQTYNSVIAQDGGDLQELTKTINASAGTTIRIESIGPSGNKDVIIDDLELFGSDAGAGTNSEPDPVGGGGVLETFTGVDLGDGYWSKNNGVNSTMVFTGAEGLSWTAYRCMNGPDVSAQLQYSGKGSLKVALDRQISSVSFKFRPEYGAGTKVIVKKGSTVIQSTPMNTTPTEYATFNVSLNASSGDTIEFVTSSDSGNSAIIDNISLE